MYGLPNNVYVVPVVPVSVNMLLPYVLLCFFVCRKLSPHLGV